MQSVRRTTGRTAEIETLQRVGGRRFSADETARLHATLSGSLRTIMAGVGMTHPSFVRVSQSLSGEGAGKL